MARRRGMGKGMGMGYKNLAPADPYVHSLSAKGVKSKKPSLLPDLSGLYQPEEVLDAETIDMVLNAKGVSDEDKESLLHKIGHGIVSGAKWAVQWEKEHLPSQKKWVKDKLHKIKTELKKMKDVDGDGDLDATNEEVVVTYNEIETDLNKIDNDNDGVPDHKEPISEHVETKKDTNVLSLASPSSVHKEGLLSSAFKNVKGAITKETEKVKSYREEVVGLSDKELKERAIRHTEFVFGGNPYKRELLRRQRTRLEVEQALKREKDRLNKRGTGGFGALGFLNPLSTIKKKK